LFSSKSRPRPFIQLQYSTDIASTSPWRSFGTTFFTQLGTISNPFLITVITDLVDTLFTPISFYTMEKVGRRPLLIWGGLGMCVCEVIVALIGTIAPDNQNAVRAMIAFICICKSSQLLSISRIPWPTLNFALLLDIAFFAGSWGPGAWVVIGEIFPLPIRSRGVGLSTASNWLWNCIIAVITVSTSRSAALSTDYVLIGHVPVYSPTWSVLTRPTSVPKSFGSGVLFADAVSCTPTS
jgi:MFS family permease